MIETVHSKKSVLATIFIFSVACNWLSLTLDDGARGSAFELLMQAIGAAIIISLFSLMFLYAKKIGAAYVCAVLLNLVMIGQGTGGEPSTTQRAIGAALGLLLIGALVYYLAAPVRDAVRLWLYRQKRQGDRHEE